MPVQMEEGGERDKSAFGITTAAACLAAQACG